MSRGSDHALNTSSRSAAIIRVKANSRSSALLISAAMFLLPSFEFAER
jgi:hypothetical protein